MSNSTRTQLVAADGTPLTVITNLDGEGTVVVRVFRDDELRTASPFMRGEFTANATYVAETVGAR